MNQQGRRAVWRITLGIAFAIVLVIGLVDMALYDGSDAMGSRTPIDLASLGPQVGRSVGRFLASEPPPQAPFDLVFIDPPYRDRALPGLLSAVANGLERWLTPAGRIVVHLPKDDGLDARYGPLRRVESRIYGQARVEDFMIEEREESGKSERAADE